MDFQTSKISEEKEINRTISYYVKGYEKNNQVNHNEIPLHTY